MSKNLDCDPNKGFVAFPISLFDLDLTPGAFRTLAELCRMANASGQCWPSLAQLGRKLGRSRASVSSYISELRANGIVVTEEQKMANGYNYRLRYTVTFWKEWRADLSKGKSKEPTAPKKTAERRVQQAERPLETKNHIHKNHTVCRDILSEWQHAVGKAPYPGFAIWPSNKLISQTMLETTKPPTTKSLISADITAAFKDFAIERGIEPFDAKTIAKLGEQIHSAAQLGQITNYLAEIWQGHWRKPPNLYQLHKLIRSLPPMHDPDTERKLLKSYLQRWRLYQGSLPSVAIQSTVAA